MANKRPARVRNGRVTQTPPVDFAVDYHYVLADLRRLAITAAGLFALLVVLALVF